MMGSSRTTHLLGWQGALGRACAHLSDCWSPTRQSMSLLEGVREVSDELRSTFPEPVGLLRLATAPAGSIARRTKPHSRTYQRRECETSEVRASRRWSSRCRCCWTPGRSRLARQQTEPGDHDYQRRPWSCSAHPPCWAESRHWRGNMCEETGRREEKVQDG